ncbi:MAG: dockerin type I repeat-containing protein [Eubacteriales bacterium]|nr:dockerin type I repeat-containing protein [Eubacteriales bacterium]
MRNKKKIAFIALVMVVALIMGVVSASGMTASELDPNNKYKYIDTVLSLLEDKMSSEAEIEYYRERYEYYSEESLASPDEATPDYVLISISTNMAMSMPIADVYGDIIMYSSSGEYPFAYGLCVYIPKTQELLGLDTAYNRGIDGIENIFTEAGVGSLIGDMDNDRKLTVKDATYVQKIIAGIEGFTDDVIYAAEFDDTLPCSLADFNRDGKRNINDATAIQKFVAKIDAK